MLLKKGAGAAEGAPVLQPLLHDALGAREIERERNLRAGGVRRASAGGKALTSHSSPMASNQPLKLSMLRGKPSTRKFQEGEENMALDSRPTVTSTGTILPSLIKLGRGEREGETAVTAGLHSGGTC